jgi:protein-disulfide isomerase
VPILIPFSRRLSLLAFAATLASLGCHAQTPAIQADAKITVGSPLPPGIARRVEVLIRQKAQLPPGATVKIGPVETSTFSGFDTFALSFTSLEGQSSHPINFLISTDGKTVAQMSKYDITPDPRSLISVEGRPGRGGPATAPVLIVGFDDLECPFCARLHTIIFPAITKRYGDKVHIVYKDYPIEQHPWAMRAAVDVNCLAAQSSTGYWDLVDSIHAHAGEIGSNPHPTPPIPDKDGKISAPAQDKTLERANEQLDTMTRDQGKLQKADATQLNACIAKQDTTKIEASKQVGLALDVEETPTLFINGDKIVGALPIEFIFNVIDDALRAENVTPPPPYVAPTAPAVSAPAAPAAKPGR